jgi:hypothetical protein
MLDPQFTTEKKPIPKNFGYTLRASMLIGALRGRGVMLNGHLIQGQYGFLFHAEFWPPNRSIAHERLYIRVSAVPASHVRAARRFVESEVVPDFVEWVHSIVVLPSNAPVRREKQHFLRREVTAHQSSHTDRAPSDSL